MPKKDSIPQLFGNIKAIDETLANRGPQYAPHSSLNFAQCTSSFGIALHMHQPTIPAASDDLQTAALISNLQHMMEHPDIGDNHNASVFLDCYRRIARFIPELVASGANPRIMLDYSGNLLWGLAQIDGGKVLDELKSITCDARYFENVEWLGSMWSHAVVSSTPVPDIYLHIRAWQESFASIFGLDALKRVKGFSPPEMHLPIHPDLCYEYVKALKRCGYEWVMVQEHTIELIGGSPIQEKHLPHLLVARNSLGEEASIPVLIKTQGSDTKLVAQMQPYYEAQGLTRCEYAKRQIPPFVLQISDGENGGVMMNEFPPKYLGVMREVSDQGCMCFNGSEYLEYIFESGVIPGDFQAVQPISQHRIWQEINDVFKPGAADCAIAKIHDRDQSFNLDKASWTSDRNWVKGYEEVLSPINQLSVHFHERFDLLKNPEDDPAYREALLYVLLSQTSCFRYWGEGLWTEYAKEICRRGEHFISASLSR